MVKEKFHGSRQNSHWRSKLEISVALVDGAFDVAAECDGQVLTNVVEAVFGYRHNRQMCTLE